MQPNVRVLALQIAGMAMLRQELPGYAAYSERVPYRLLPRVW